MNRLFMLVIVLVATMSTMLGQVTGGMRFKESGGVNQTSRPFIVNRFFECGTMSAYPKPLVNSNPVALWQVTIKSHCADGTTQHAIIVFHSDLGANTEYSLSFQNDSNACYLGNQATCDAAAQSQANMLAFRGGSWGIQVELTNGTTQTADVRSLVAAGKYTYWVKGPVLNWLRVEDTSTYTTADKGFAVATAGANIGSVVKGLHPQFQVLIFPNYTAGVRVSASVENIWDNSLINQVYSFVIKTGSTGSTTVVNQSSFTHLARTRWYRGGPHDQIWDGTAPGPVQFDYSISYLIQSKVLPNYDTTNGVVPDIAGDVSAFQSAGGGNRGIAPMTIANVYSNMGATGARKDIGFVHRGQLDALYGYMTPDIEQMVFQYGNIAGYMPIHFREHRTDNFYCTSTCTSPNTAEPAFGHPLSAETRPSLDLSTTNNYASSTVVADRVVPVGTMAQVLWDGNISPPNSSGQSGFDVAHHPSLAYIPYILSGDPYYLDEHMYLADYLSLWLAAGFRNNEWSLPNYRVFQWRGVGWYVRSRGQAGFMAPDGPLKQNYFKWFDRLSETFEGYFSDTTGNFPPVDSSCPGGYTSISTGPTTGANRSAWCWGKWWMNKGKANTLKLPPGQQSSDCQTQYWTRFNCLNVQGGEQVAPWMIAYTLISLGWVKESFNPNTSKAFEFLATHYVEGFANAPEAARVRFLGGEYAYWGQTQLTGSVSGSVHTSNNGHIDGPYPTTWADFAANMVRTTLTTLSSGIGTSEAQVTIANPGIFFTPIWRRYMGTYAGPITARSNAITSLTVSGGLITAVFDTAHGLLTGHQILGAAHTNAMFNTQTAGGSLRAYRFITSTPNANTLTYWYIPTHSSVAKSGGNTGTGTVSFTNGFDPVVPGTLGGVWLFRCTAAATNGGTFSVTDPLGGGHGTITISAGSATYVVDANTKVKISDGGTDFVVGDGFDVTIQTLPDGTYTDSASPFFLQTPRGTITMRVGTETMNVCGIETSGVITLDGDGTQGGTQSQTATTDSFCTPNASRGRGANGSPRIAHSSGEVVSNGFDVWTDATNPAGGYSWICRAAASFMYGLVTASGSGNALWAWLDSNMYQPNLSILTASKDNTWNFAPRGAIAFHFTTGSLPSGTVGVAYSQRLFVANQTGTVTFGYTGTLPTGLSLNTSTGFITGTPSAVQSTSVQFSAFDSGSGATILTTLGIAINGPLISITPLSLPSGTVGSAYSQPMTAVGGTGPYTWSRSAGTFPNGVSIDAAGNVAGTPTNGGAFSVTLRATDSLGNSGDQAYTFNVAWLPLSITTSASLPSGVLGNPYSQTLGYTGGNGVNHWTVSGGTIPAGLGLADPTGVLSGTPTAAQPYSFTVTVCDTEASPQCANRTFSLTVNVPLNFTTILQNIRWLGRVF